MSHEPYFFTWQSQENAKGARFLGGSGCFFETEEGRFLDFGSLVWQANAGHGHSKIALAIKAQADAFCLAAPNAVYPEKRELAERLLAKAPPGYSKVFFSLGGSDANENALKIARMVTGRYKTISRYRGYHGATMGAVSLSGDWRRNVVEPGIPGAIHVLDLDDPAQATVIPRTLELEGDVGAVFLESIVGANGVLIPPPGYYEEIRSACDKHGALLVADEVLVGFGRTGKFWGFEHWNVVPDMITCGKALTGGYGTLGAVLVHERVAERFEKNVLACGLTHYAHPIGIATALAMQKVIDDEKLVERAAAMESVVSGHMESLRLSMPNVIVRTRGKGLIAAMDLALDDAAVGRLNAALKRERIHAHVKSPAGLRAPLANIAFAPPLCISKEELADGFTRIARALASL